MDLTPEEKAVGKENFQAAIGSPLLRREFLQEGIRQNVASGRGLGPYYFGYDKTLAEPIRVGFLGTGDEGNVLIGAINPEFVQVTAMADVRPYNVHRAFHGDHYSDKALAARPGLMKKYEWSTEDEARRHVKVYGDYRELLENEKDLDAVVIALPLHLHAPAAIAAMRAGKHVLTEKLMAHSVHECKQMARVARETNLHLATGHQRHYSILYDNAVKAIAAGLLGDLHYIRAQWHRGNLPGTDSWQQPLPKKAKPGDPQADRLDKELASWQKKSEDLNKELDKQKNASKPDVEKIEKLEADIPIWEAKVAQKLAQISDELIAETAEQFGYRHELIEGVYDRPAIEELIRWRLWNRTGGGLMAELGSHQLDAASIFISAMHGGEKQYPLCVAAAANRPLFPVDREVADHVYCLFEFPAPDYDPNDEYRRRKKISVAYASINGNGFGGHGETVFGTKGTLILEREQDALLYKTASTTGKIKLGKGPKIEPADKGDSLSAAIGTQALAVAERGYTEQLEHWAWCIRANPNNSDPALQPRCHPKVALADAVIALVSNVAAREGRRVDFKPEWFDPASDETPEGVKPGAGEVA